MDTHDAIVIGAGQAGLSASYHLKRRGVEHLVLDANSAPGGAWQHRWPSLTMDDVHGVADLPGLERQDGDDAQAAREVVPAYFDSYEESFELPILRPVEVDDVTDEGQTLLVRAADRRWRARTIVNATGTWTRPFIPYYPGIASFAGRQLHTVDFTRAEDFTGQRVLVVGGGQSAVQFLGQLAPVTDTLWVTRREPRWRDDEFTPEAGRAAVALVEDRVRQGLPPQSVVSVTGLLLRPQEEAARLLGAYERRPMFARIETGGVRWDDGSFERVDVILWATGFRHAIDHLAPLRLRGPLGGIALDGTTAVADPRVQLVGYGPSASTIGANRAGRSAALGVIRWLSENATTVTGPGDRVASGGRIETLG